MKTIIKNTTLCDILIPSDLAVIEVTVVGIVTVEGLPYIVVEHLVPFVSAAPVSDTGTALHVSAQLPFKV